ncbi:MAG: hypothetical protein R3A79_21255 [Nannocystaceae bacterium]
MRWSTAAPRLALAALVAGCDPADLADAEASAESTGGEAPPSAWVELDATRFASDGESETLTIPAQAPGAVVALRATTAADVCFQLSALVDGEGRELVAGRSAGPYCRDCALRSSAAAASGVFVFAGEPGVFAPERGLELRFARLRCETLTPLTAADDAPPLRLELQTFEAAPEPAAIDLRFLIGEASILRGDAARQEALLQALAAELSSAGIVPRLVDAQPLDPLAVELRFHAGDPSALADALAAAPAKAEATVDVVFAGCLLYDDPVFGPPRALSGYTPRIPGGAGEADAVYMPGLDCVAPDAEPAAIPVELQARVLAHELGHYLGLYHAVEEDGGSDTLADTGPDNIMHFNPTRAAAVGFSPSQGAVMRTHPAVRGADAAG